MNIDILYQQESIKQLNLSIVVDSNLEDEKKQFLDGFFSGAYFHYYIESNEENYYSYIFINDKDYPPSYKQSDMLCVDLSDQEEEEESNKINVLKKKEGVLNLLYNDEEYNQVPLNIKPIVDGIEIVEEESSGWIPIIENKKTVEVSAAKQASVTISETKGKNVYVLLCEAKEAGVSGNNLSIKIKEQKNQFFNVDIYLNGTRVEHYTPNYYISNLIYDARNSSYVIFNNRSVSGTAGIPQTEGDEPIPLTGGSDAEYKDINYFTDKFPVKTIKKDPIFETNLFSIKEKGSLEEKQVRYKIYPIFDKDSIIEENFNHLGKLKICYIEEKSIIRISFIDKENQEDLDGLYFEPIEFIGNSVCGCFNMLGNISINEEESSFSYIQLRLFDSEGTELSSALNLYDFVFENNVIIVDLQSL